MLCITINYLLEHLDKLGVRRKQERQVVFFLSVGDTFSFRSLFWLDIGKLSIRELPIKA